MRKGKERKVEESKGDDRYLRPERQGRKHDREEDIEGKGGK